MLVLSIVIFLLLGAAGVPFWFLLLLAPIGGILYAMEPDQK